MDPLPVTLIVKAPNHGEYQDHTVKCELSWTIKRLKGHLSEVYPCKPEEQKLIYSGQLLQDAVVLKDILRQYDGQETHTVHLVYTPKQQQQQTPRYQMDKKEDTPDATSSASGPGAAESSSLISDTPSSSSSEGLRRRYVGSATTTNTTPIGSPQTSAGVAAAAAGQSPTFNLQSFYSQPFTTTSPTAQQQVVTSELIAAYQQWYQAQYANYVNQYMAYMNSIQQNVSQPPMPAMQWPGMMPSYMPGQGGLPIVGSTAHAGNAVAVGEQGGQQQQQQGAGQQAPRFPMLVHEPERPERDWLDFVHTCWRVSFLLLMIYFYSSALRFTIVMCAILAIYLYRNRRALNGPTAAAAPVAQPVVQPANPVAEEVGEGEAAAAGEGGERDGAAAPVPGRPDNNNNLNVANRNATQEPNNAPTTVLSFVRTLVTSFVYSLLPEPAMGP